MMEVERDLQRSCAHPPLPLLHLHQLPPFRSPVEFDQEAARNGDEQLDHGSKKLKRIGPH